MLAVGDGLPDAVSLPELLAEPVAEANDVVDREAETVEDPDDAVLLVAALDALESDEVAEPERVTLDAPVGIRLIVLLATSELEVEESSAKSTTILISVHWSPMDSSYRLPNAPLMHRHHLVDPPMARDLFWHTAKPPV